MKNCKFCDKDGTAWLYPMAYAVVVGANGGDLAASPALSGTLGAGVTDIKLGDRARYAIRRARRGYIYVLIERFGYRSWRCYMVLEDSFLYEFDAERPPIAPEEFNCERNACGVGASVIGIDKVGTVDNVWVLFTPSAMTQAKLDEYRTHAPAYASKGRMRYFDVKGWVAGNTSQPHTLKPEKLMTTAAEFVLFRQHEKALSNPLGLAMKAQLFPASSDAYAGTPPQADGSENGFLGVLTQKLVKQKAAVLVLDDPIGITQELNDFRNAAIDQLRPWLQTTDAKTGVANERKVHVLGAVDDVGAAFQAGLVSNEQQAIEQHRQSTDNNLQRRFESAKALRLQGRIEQAQAIEADVERARKTREVNYQRAVADARVNAPKAWGKYVKRLPGLEPLRKQFQDLTAQHETTLLARVDDHLRWLRSPGLIAAFDTYDRSSVASGQALQDQVGLAILGMNYTEAGTKLVLEWAQAQAIKADNLLLRAYCLNQDDIERAMAQSIATARSAAEKPATGMAWWSSLDLVQSGMKNAIDAFDKANAALETLPANHGHRSSLAGMGAVVYTTMGQAVFELGLNGQTSGLGRLYIGVLAASLGRLNSRVRLSELAHAGSAAQAMPDAQRSQGQATRRVREAIEAEVTRGKGGDAYKIRVAGVIALIEAFGLFMRATKEDKQTKEYLELTGAALAVAAAGFELMAVGVEYVQRNHRSVTMSNRGASVALGGIKLFAGVLGSFAGAVGAVYDFVDADAARRRSRYGLMVALYGRGLAQGSLAILGAVIGYSFCGPLFEFMAARARSQVGQGVAQGLARGAYWLARPAVGASVARIALLIRVVGCITWVSIGITILLFAFADDALENWCDKSSFRPNPKPDDGFSDEGKELEALYLAFNEVK